MLCSESLSCSRCWAAAVKFSWLKEQGRYFFWRVVPISRLRCAEVVGFYGVAERYTHTHHPRALIMPSSVRVRVVEARDLPEMDRTVRGEFCTDAYVDIKFRNYEQVQIEHTYVAVLRGQRHHLYVRKFDVIPPREPHRTYVANARHVCNTRQWQDANSAY